MGPEVQAVFPEALQRVSGLYAGEVLADALVHGGAMPTLDPSRDELWRSTAKKFPPFQNKIIGLKLALDNARQAITKEGEILRVVVEGYFDDAENMGVRHLLGTILCSRATMAQGQIDPEIILEVEVKAMRAELGLGENGDTLDLESMSFRRGIGKVLSGELSLSRQTQP